MKAIKRIVHMDRPGTLTIQPLCKQRGTDATVSIWWDDVTCRKCRKMSQKTKGE